MEGDSTQEPRAEAVDAVAEPGLVESFVGNYPTHYILGNDDEVGQRCSANFAMADSAELAKEGKLAEFVEQSFGDKLGDDEGDAGDGAAVEPLSLYEAQLRQRLGYVPAWLNSLK